MEQVQILPNDAASSYNRGKTLVKRQKGYAMQQIAARTLGTGSVEQAVQLPHGEDLNEWLAVNTLDFYNEVLLIYSPLSDFCTPSSCPTMTAGPNYEYLWVDPGSAPQHLSAQEYIDKLLNWVESNLENDSLFPVHKGALFSASFLPTIKVIFKRLFRVYAHIYHSHFPEVVALGLECHLNTSFKHFLFFIDQFALVTEEELLPLEKLIEQFRERSRGVTNRVA